MSETIKVNVFDRKSISDAISILREKQDEVEGKHRKTVEELTQIGYEYLMSIIKVESGELADSVTWNFDEKNNIGKIGVGSSYAIYVEYGTGIVGANNPHPQPAPGWSYDVNKHGEKGWTYWDTKAQKFRRTKGQPATAFMYRTLEYMKKQADEVLRVNMYG